MFQLSQRSLNHLNGVNGALVKVITRALELTNVDFGIPVTGGKRTTEQQQALFHADMSQLDGIKNKSKHQLGLAFDVFAYVDGTASWDEADLSEVAAAILQAAVELRVPIKWGGTWKGFKDYPHFELVG